jgi:hypothetical protein
MFGVGNLGWFGVILEPDVGVMFCSSALDGFAGGCFGSTNYYRFLGALGLLLCLGATGLW